MTGIYDLKLVLLSLVVASLASYTALDLAGRISEKRGQASWLWLLGGAFSMGTGIWSMHFIGMLAFRLPIPLAYDVGLNLLSWVIAMAVSGVALFVALCPALTGGNVTLGAAFMGVGISSMHYTGMAAMKMSPPIQYDPALFILSVLIAIAASLAALWIAFKLRRRYSALAIAARLASALVMGVGITGMHYTGMAAAEFASDAVCLAADSTGGLDNSMLAVIIGLATFSILAITLVISAFDAQLSAHTARLARTLQAANDKLRDIALYDKLTGLPNRHLLEDRLQQAINHARRTRGLFAVMFVDLDRFKRVNDSFGHHIGDGLLQAVAQRLKTCVRGEDTVARAGGDEFVIVLGEISHSEDAALIGGKILAELSEPLAIERIDLDLSCSIGISVFPADGEDIATLMVNADRAMYYVKRSGRNGYRFFGPEIMGVAAQPSPAP